MCNDFHISDAVILNKDCLGITFKDCAVDILNNQRFCFRVCQPIPLGGAALPVMLLVNGTPVCMLNKYGTPVIGANLKTRCVYRGYYVSDCSAHVIVYNTPLDENCRNNCFM